MFTGRENELKQLEKCFAKGCFQMVVLYGRRRVGKTTLLQEFSKGKRTLFFTAQIQSDQDNLADFSRTLHDFFELPSYMASFASWDDAFSLVADKAATEHFLFIFDEFPYAVASCEALPSKLQIAIDHHLKRTDLCLVLCGSDQGFMESEVLGKKSPLYGRRSIQIRLCPFNFRDTANMLSWAQPEDAFKYYACVGGTPYYLSQTAPDLTFEENLADLFFNPMGFLYGEPLMLLQQELREPALYNSVLRAIASGANRQNEIANKTGIAASSLPKYLQTMIRLDLIERIVPFGENPQTSKRGIYRLYEACYAFWYRFVAPFASNIEAGAGKAVARNVQSNELADYLGHRFERVCQEWLLLKMTEESLPFPAINFGSWWGTDPSKREQADIDVIAGNSKTRQIILGECKWRTSFNEAEALNTLKDRSTLIKDYSEHWYILFSKLPLAATTQAKVNADDHVSAVCLADMYGDL